MVAFGGPVRKKVNNVGTIGTAGLLVTTTYVPTHSECFPRSSS